MYESLLYFVHRIAALTNQLAREFGKYFEKIVDMFARIGDVLPRFRVYEQLFANHEHLVHALSLVYYDVLVFCADAKAAFRRGKRTSGMRRCGSTQRLIVI